MGKILIDIERVKRVLWSVLEGIVGKYLKHSGRGTTHPAETYNERS